MEIRAKVTILNTILFSTLMMNFSFASSPSMAKEPLDTCADLQRIANRVVKEKGRNQIFHGFEKLSMQTDVYQYATRPGTDRLCQTGYLTETSPMGKQICLAHIYANTESGSVIWDIGYFRTTIYGPTQTESEFCRWL